MPPSPPPAPPLPLHLSARVGRHRVNRSVARPPDPTSSSPSPKPPSPPLETVSDVRAWLHARGLAQYADAFTANEITGPVLRTLTSEELRDDLGVVNLRHRRDLLDAVAALRPTTPPPALPEHGRILDHLSNVRTYHSWVRVAVQLLGFAVVTLRLAPNFRDTPIVAAAAFYFACVGILALVYGVYRYRAVIRMIERADPAAPRYTPDRGGILLILVLVFIASVLSLTIIALRPS